MAAWGQVCIFQALRPRSRPATGVRGLSLAPRQPLPSTSSGPSAGRADDAQQHLAILQWARQHGCPWDERTCSSAAYGGHLAVLQWLLQHGTRGTAGRARQQRTAASCGCCSGRASRAARGTRTRAPASVRCSSEGQSHGRVAAWRVSNASLTAVFLHGPSGLCAFFLVDNEAVAEGRQTLRWPHPMHGVWPDGGSRL